MPLIPTPRRQRKRQRQKGRSLSIWGQGQLGIHREFTDSQSYKMKLCLKPKPKPKPNPKQSKQAAAVFYSGEDRRGTDGLNVWVEALGFLPVSDLKASRIPDTGPRLISGVLDHEDCWGAGVRQFSQRPAAEPLLRSDVDIFLLLMWRIQLSCFVECAALTYIKPTGLIGF